MKKVIVTLACVLAIGAASAQENNTKKFELGCNIGMTTFSNYSALSLFQDATDSYSNWSGAIHFGYRINNSLLGVQAQHAHFNTSALALDETAMWWNFSLMLRHYIPIGGNWETFYGLKFGLSVTENSFKYLGDDYSRTRLGMNGEFETGIHYRFDNGNHIGLRVAFNLYGSHFDKDLNLPAGLNANDKRFYGGYTLSLQYGIRF